MLFFILVKLSISCQQQANVKPESGSKGRYKNTYYYGDGLIFLPADAPPEFLRALEKGSYICDVMSALKYGNYYGSDMFNE